jgi:hypothetical protein
VPRWSKTLVDANGKWLGVVCGRSPFRKCTVPECRRHATLRCDYPVMRATATRKAKSATCDRWICERHAKHVDDDCDFCPAHARAADALKRAEVPRAPEPPVQIELGLADFEPPLPPCRHCGRPIPPGQAYSAIPYDPKSERVVRLPGSYHGACAEKLGQLMRIPCDE